METKQVKSSLGNYAKDQANAYIEIIAVARFCHT
jgi:hypothetical protein